MGWFDELLGRPTSAERLAKAKAHASAEIDRVLVRVIAGSSVSAADLDRAQAAFAALYDALSEVNGTKDNRRFSDEDRADFYVLAIEMTAIGHPEHSAWPFRSDLRRMVAPTLRRRFGRGAGPWTHLACILPSLLAKDLGVARHCLAQLERDPYLRKLALDWVNDCVMQYPKQNDVPTFEAFLAPLGLEDAWNPRTEVMPDAERWPLLATMDPSLVADPRLTLADTRPVPLVRAMLADSWGVVDRASARRVIASLIERGHRSEVAAVLAGSRTTTPERQAFVESHRRELESIDVCAWDHSRAIGVARASLTCGFLDEGETRYAIDGAAERLRDAYGSWAELTEGYVLGGSYFAPEEVTYSPFLGLAHWLRDSPRSPWRHVAFGAR